MPGGNKTSRREAALAALLACPTIEAAAAAAGVSERTLRNWLAQPDFRAQYAEARAGLLERCIARLLAVCTKAADALARNLDSDKPGASIRAAQLILELSFKGHELLDLAERVAELERLVRQQSGRTAA